MLRKLFGGTVLRYSRRFSNLIMGQRYQNASLAAIPELEQRYPRVHKYLQLQIAEKGANHSFSSYKLLELLQILESRKPRLIIEFGSGSTTAAFAEYAERNPACKIISVDEYEPYQQDVFERLGHAGFAVNQQIQRCFCPKIIEKQDNAHRTRYTPNYIELLAGQAPDLIYVDGPTTSLPDNPTANIPCVDVIYLCQQDLFPQLVLFDYRIQSVRAFLKTDFRYQYTLLPHYMVMTPDEEPWVIDSVRHHSELRIIV